VAPSSQRFKQNVHSMGEASSVVLALRPVSFEYKKELDPDSIPPFGLVAEDVERLIPIWWPATLTEKLTRYATKP